jgi:Cu2+-exporting ATPase
MAQLVDAGPVTPVPGAACFHCGLPVPAGSAFRFAVAEGSREFCCAGCEAVSTAIHGLGLEEYYRLRRENPARPETTVADLEAFDAPAVRDRFVQACGEDRVEAQLLVEGLRCAACAWLVERTLARVPGVESVQVQYATRRASVRWDPAAAQPSTLLRAVTRIGYAAWPYDEGRLALVAASERRSLLRRLWVAGLGMMQVMMYAVPTYLATEGEIGVDAQGLLSWAGLVLTLPVLLYSAGPMFRGAWRDLRERHLGMDVPVALGLGAAFLGSAWNTVRGSGEVYFDSVTMFVFLLLGARYLEMAARARAGQALLPLARLVPQSAHRLKDARGLETETVAAAALAPGDRILVRPGETLPADGELESPQATLDEAWMTGESRPVVHSAGDTLLGGAVNAGSALTLAVRRVGDATSISSIHRLMERALGERPRWADAAQRAVPPFIAAVLLAAAAAFLAWLAIDPERAPWIAISVLIVTCPCALALAAPAAVTLATGAFARRRVVVARLDAIESLAGVTDIVFDKTGTLTAARPALAETYAFHRGSAPRMLALAAALSRGSSHPLDAALVEAACGMEPVPATRHESFPGEGIEALVDGVRMRLGRREFAGALHGMAAPLAFMSARDPVAWLADETGWLAAFRFSDRLRPDARAAVTRLEAQGVQVHMLSGDGADIVGRLARELGIERWEAGATPATKRAYVHALQSAGLRVAMVGDGINDAPVLAQADVSLAMGCGADVARMRADMVLLADSPADVAGALEMARRTRRIVRQNLGWALAYNAIAIPLALAGLVTPLAAGIGMSASSLVVVANALRVRA